MNVYGFFFLLLGVIISSGLIWKTVASLSLTLLQFLKGEQ